MARGSRKLRRRRSKVAHPFQLLERRDLFAVHILGSSTGYATIQAAVNAAAPGAVINVDAGTYAEKVTVNKAGLTIRGPQAGVDARTNGRPASITTATEAIVTGATISPGVVSCAFYVSANDVTIDGFTVQGESYKNSDTGAGLVLAPNIAGTHVVDNVVQNNYAGMFLSNSSPTDACLIQHNLFRDNYNPNDTQGYAYSGNDNRSIYSDGAVSGGKLTNVTIDANGFVYDMVPPDNVEGAIGLECYTSGAQTNIRVTNNVMDGVGKCILYYDVVGLTVTGNTMTHVGDVWTGVFRDEGNCQNVTIQYNNVYDSYGPVLRIDNRAAPGNSANYHFNFNNVVNDGTSVHGGISFYQQTGIKAVVYIDPNGYTGTIDLANNWWGDKSGPSGTGYAGTGGAITSETKTPLTATVSPWATAAVVPLASAYLGIPATDGVPVQAEFFNHGGLGVGYSNANSTSPGGKFRNGETVGVIASTDAGGGFAVASTKAGDWLDYTVTLATAGTYRFDLRYTATAAATVHATVDGVNVTGAMALPASGWATAAKAGLTLSAGTHVVRVFVDAGTPTLNWFALTNTGTPPPAAAATLVASAVSASQVVLTWGSPSKAAVKVQRSTDGTTWATVATVTANNYVDVGLSAGTAYQYRVLATGAGGDAVPSNTAAATTASPATLPQYLSDLSWTSATSGYATVQRDKTVVGNPLTLNGIAYAKGLGTHAASTITYALGGAYTRFAADVGVDDEVNGKGDGSVDFKVVGDGVTLFDSGTLTNDRVAHVDVSVAGVKSLQLVATNVAAGIDFDHADWANAAVYGTPTAPAAPTGLTAKLATTTTAALAWTAGSANTTGYTVQRSVDGVTFATIATTTATTYTDAGPLAAATPYTYRVLAANAVGTSPASAAASVTTVAAGTVTAYLSDLTPTAATTGYGSVMKDATVAGKPITLNGVAYAKGVGVHAVSGLTYALGGQYATFAADVGVDDEVNGKGVGSVDFQVIGDGRVLFDSGVVQNGVAATRVSVSVAGVQQLKLVATNGVAGVIDYDHADWAGATLTGSPTAPGVPANLAAAAPTSTAVNLTWTAPGTNVSAYAVDRSTDNVTFATVTTTVPGGATAWTDPTTLSPSTRYYYRVRAVNPAGSSANSAVASVVTPAKQTATYLSDLVATSATSGYGTVQKDRSIGGNAITLAGTTYAKGIGTHASSTVSYSLTGGTYTTFASTVGVDDEENGRGVGTVRFQVWGDGVLLFDSGVLTNNQTANAVVSLAGVKTLTLVANDGGDGIDYDHADWADAKLLA